MESESMTTGKITLNDAIFVEGEEIKSIEYDFDSVKSIQYINLVSKLSKKKGQISVPEVDTDVQLGYFSLASNISLADLKRIERTSDMISILSITRNFLLGVSDVME